jgi:hypothetical protein
MRIVDENGNELTWEQAIAMSPKIQERIRENGRILNQTEADVIHSIALRLMGEPRPPASWDDAMEIARDTYAAMIAEGD